jgi:basic membrane lipoprotein Med (substrate-binding protein (PBP1-ABC) superfamily)
MDQEFILCTAYVYKQCLHCVVSTFLNENDMRWLLGHLLAQLSNDRRAPYIDKIVERVLQYRFRATGCANYVLHTP